MLRQIDEKGLGLWGSGGRGEPCEGEKQEEEEEEKEGYSVVERVGRW